MTNKTKNIILVIGFILALFICYRFSIYNTFGLKKQYHSLAKEEILSKSIPKQLSILKQKEKYYDSLLNKHQLEGTSIQNNLLKMINSFSKNNNLKVVNFNEPHVFLQNDLMVKTYEFTIEGDYNSIISLIYQLEQKTKFGEIINLDFEKKKNFKTNKYFLQAKVLLKSFG